MPQKKDKIYENEEIEDIPIIPEVPIKGGTPAHCHDGFGSELLDIASLPSGVTQIFYQATAPTIGVRKNDYWIDSDDNKIYRYSGTAWVEVQDDDIATAITDAATAQATADGKIYVYKQDATPASGMGTGDLWFDTDDGNKAYRYSGAAWEEVKDTGITTAIANAATAQSTADGKITTFIQTSAPTAEGTGDLWADSDDGYRTYRWSGSAWVDIQDTDVGQALSDAATAQVAADAAQADATTGISNAATAQAEADRKIVSFYQTSAPTAEQTGDLWFDTDDDNKSYRWSGSAWNATEFDVASWSKIIDDDTHKPADDATEGGTIGTDVKDEDADVPAQGLIVNFRKYLAGAALVAGNWVGLGKYNADKAYLDSANWKDAYVDKDNANTNYGTSTSLFVGTADAGATIDGQRYYIYIDMNDIPENFQTVKLSLWKWGLNNATEIKYKVCKVSANFNEGTITWNTKPADDDVSWVTGMFTGTGAVHEIDITPLVALWKAGIYANNGLVIKCTGRSGAGAGESNFVSYSTESASAEEAQIAVKGLEDMGKIYKTNESFPEQVYNHIGIVKETIASGNSGKVQVQGIVSGLSNLIVGNTYFLGSAVGQITNNPSTGNLFKVGIALSATELQLMAGVKMQAGSFLTSATAGITYYTYPIYFRPNKIEFHAINAGVESSFGVAWGRNTQKYQTNYAGTPSYGSDAIFYDGNVVRTKISVLGIYGGVMVLKIVNGSSALATQVNWVATG